ncbi:MAG: hypothetical protein KDA05_04965, partial [Phycisphaerales bacterium]|nr:hypothetical protein [Phycisphaerales bacterium]
MDVSGACVLALAVMALIWTGDGPAPEGPDPGRGGDAIVHSTPAEPAQREACDESCGSDEPQRARSATDARDLDPARNIAAAAALLRAYAPLVETGERDVADAAGGNNWTQRLDESLDRVENDDDLFAAIVDLLGPLGAHGFVFVRTTDGRSWRRDESRGFGVSDGPSDPEAAIIESYLAGDGGSSAWHPQDPGFVIARLRDGTLYARPSLASPGGRAPDYDAGLGELLRGLARGEAVVVDLRFGDADLGTGPWDLA